MLRLNENIVLRNIHGSIFLIDITDNYAGDKCALYEINETGRFIWENINSAGTIELLTKLLLEAIVDEIPYQIIFNDVSEFVADLIEKKFILEVSSTNG